MTTGLGTPEHTAKTRPWASFRRRVGRALVLDPRLFEEVEHDPAAFTQSLAIVVVAGLARGVFVYPSEAVVGLVGGVAGALFLWWIGAALVTGVGVAWLGGTTNFREMLRTLGFAALPLWSLAPAFALGGWARLSVSALVHAWAVAAAVIAVRQALDCGTARAAAACGIALAVGLGILVLLGVPVAH